MYIRTATGQRLAEAQQAVAVGSNGLALGGGGAEVLGVEGAIQVGVGARGLDAGEAKGLGIRYSGPKCNSCPG